MSNLSCSDIHRAFSRRHFLRLATAGAAAVMLPGCVTNPVTQRKQFMLLSESDEINIDRENAPHAVAEDFGTLAMPSVNAYLDRVGKGLAAQSHRPAMPYAFKSVNASYVNAYAFPGGSIATTRGILLKLENEAQLAALLGHEIGHVNARHTASRMSKGMLIQLAVAGTSLALAQKKEEYGALAETVGAVGAGLLLAHYSREDERQADALGMEYMVRAGANPQGMPGLMAMLQSLREGDPNVLELMFATHPMSRERFETTQKLVAERYAEAATRPDHRERYLDETKPLRAYADVVKSIQQGDKSLAQKKLPQAEKEYRAALKGAPDDYEALIKLSRCLLEQGRKPEAQALADQAVRVAPQEPLAYRAAGLAALESKRFEAAHAAFSRYETLLPGNPETRFLDGLSLDLMGRKEAAAREYAAYLQKVTSGVAAQHAYGRLQQWQMIQP